MFTVLLKLYSAARNASPIETGMKRHAQAHSVGEGEAGDEDEDWVDMTMIDDRTGIGIGIAQGVMKATIIMDEAAAADLTMIGSIAVGRAVITMLLNILLNIIIRCLSSNSIRNLLLPRLHP